MKKEHKQSNIIVSMIFYALIFIMSGISKIICTKNTTKRGIFSIYDLSMLNYYSFFKMELIGNLE